MSVSLCLYESLTFEIDRIYKDKSSGGVYLVLFHQVLNLVVRSSGNEVIDLKFRIHFVI